MQPSRTAHLHDAAVAALWTVAATLLALAALDYLAYDFVVIDLLAYEERLHGPPGNPYLRSDFHTIAGRATVVCAGVAAVTLTAACLLARIRRLARHLLTIGAAATATLAATLVAAGWSDRLRLRPDVEPGTGALWLTHRGSLGALDPGFPLDLLLVAIPALALVSILVVRRAHTWRLALATAVPAAITVGALDWLNRTYGRLTAIGHEAWVTDVQTTRLALIAAAVLLALVGLLIRTRPAISRLRRGPPALLLCLGVAAVFATQSHRRTIDTFYPLRDPGATHLPLDDWPHPKPWTVDVTPITTCAPAPSGTGMLIRRGADGQPFLRHDYHHPVPLADGEALASLHATYRPGSHHAPDQHFALLVDRRIPLAAVVPLLTGLPGPTRFTFSVAGAYTQTLPSADGPLHVWTLCSLGELQLAALRTTSFAPDATWADVVDDPALVHRPEAE